MSYKNIGIIFAKDNDSGIAEIIITDVTVYKEEYRAKVDLTQKDRAASSYDYEKYVYWYSAEQPTHEYTVTVRHAGSYNQTATGPVGPEYHLQVLGFLVETDLVNTAKADVYVMSWHTDYPSTVYYYLLDKENATSFERTQNFLADGAQEIFILSGDNRAKEFIGASTTNGAIWLSPNDISFSYGSNVPAFDDSKIGADGYFGIKFDSAPAEGSIIGIKYRPLVNRFKVRTLISQPNDGGNIFDDTAPTRLLSHALEIIGNDRS